MSRYMMKLIMVIFLSFVITFCYVGCRQKSDKDDMAEMINTRVDQELSQDAEDMLEKNGYAIVDVRPQEEYDMAHVEEAICIPLDTISDTQPKELPNLDQIIIVYGRTAKDSAEATKRLQDIGYNYVYDLGGVMDADKDSESTTTETDSKTSNGSAGGKLPSSNGAGKHQGSGNTTTRKKKSTSATTTVDPDDHDIEGYYEDNRDIYEDIDEAYDGFEDDEDAWEDY